MDFFESDLKPETTDWILVGLTIIVVIFTVFIWQLTNTNVSLTENARNLTQQNLEVSKDLNQMTKDMLEINKRLLTLNEKVTGLLERTYPNIEASFNDDLRQITISDMHSICLYYYNDCYLNSLLEFYDKQRDLNGDSKLHKTTLTLYNRGADVKNVKVRLGYSTIAIYRSFTKVKPSDIFLDEVIISEFPQQDYVFFDLVWLDDKEGFLIEIKPEGYYNPEPAILKTPDLNKEYKEDDEKAINHIKQHGGRDLSEFLYTEEDKKNIEKTNKLFETIIN